MEALNKLRAMREAATPGMFPAENRYRDAVIKAAPALIELCEAQEAEMKAVTMYHATAKSEREHIRQRCIEASSAVEVARAKLEAAL